MDSRRKCLAFSRFIHRGAMEKTLFTSENKLMVKVTVKEISALAYQLNISVHRPPTCKFCAFLEFPVSVWHEEEHIQPKHPMVPNLCCETTHLIEQPPAKQKIRSLIVHISMYQQIQTCWKASWPCSSDRTQQNAHLNLLFHMLVPFRCRNDSPALGVSCTSWYRFEPNGSNTITRPKTARPNRTQLKITKAANCSVFYTRCSKCKSLNGAPSITVLEKCPS